MLNHYCRFSKGTATSHFYIPITSVTKCFSSILRSTSTYYNHIETSFDKFADQSSVILNLRKTKHSFTIILLAADEIAVSLSKL